MCVFLNEFEIFGGHVGSKSADGQKAEHHHDLLPPGLGLILQRLLGVVGRPRRVLDGALHVRVYSVDHLALVLNQLGNVDEHVVQLRDGFLQVEEHLVSVLDVVDGLTQLILVAFDPDVTQQLSALAGLQHVFQLFNSTLLCIDSQLLTCYLMTFPTKLVLAYKIQMKKKYWIDENKPAILLFFH